MKKSWCFAACMVALVAVACGGGSNTPSIDVFSPADFLSGDPGSDIPSVDPGSPDAREVPQADVPDVTPQDVPDALPPPDGAEVGPDDQPEVDAGCRSAADCSDEDPCSLDQCDVLTGVCSHKPIADCRACGSDAACDDGNACTLDKCLDPGICQSTCACTATCANDADCFTGDLCRPATCETTKGLPGRCSETACVPTPVECDDQDDCTIDSCDSSTGACSHAKIGGCGSCASDTECDDGNPCTIDNCSPVLSVCTHGANPCDDLDDCTEDSCNPSFGCQHVQSCVRCATDADCADGNACTVDVCDVATGRCTFGPTPCDDGLACTRDSCDAVKGCIHAVEAGACKADSGCDDGDPLHGGSLRFRRPVLRRRPDSRVQAVLAGRGLRRRERLHGRPLQPGHPALFERRPHALLR